MLKPTELAIADVMKHPSLGLISFQPTLTDMADTMVRVRDVKGRLFQVDLDECNCPNKSECDRYWREFPAEDPEMP